LTQVRHLATLYVLLVSWLVKTLIFYGSARQTMLAMPALAIFAALVLVGWCIRIFSFLRR